MDKVIELAVDDGLFYTLQGEGKRVGHPCTFIRTNLCNLRCSWQNRDGSITRCDTPHTSFEPNGTKVSIDKILEYVLLQPSYEVVVSGGEPYFQKSVVDLFEELHRAGRFVTVETNGTIYREAPVDFISISPKLKSSSACPINGKKHDNNRINYGALAQFISNHNYQFKFVINEESEIIEIEEIRSELKKRTGIDISDKIYLMPQGISEEQFKEKNEWLFEVCKRKNWKYTPRYHIHVYGARKGV